MVRVNLVIDVLMGRVRAPARLGIYVSERQKSQFTSREYGDTYFGHLYHDADHQWVVKKTENALTPYALQEKKPFTSFVTERSLSYRPATSRNSSATLT